jgi:hypothetical protein
VPLWPLMPLILLWPLNHPSCHNNLSSLWYETELSCQH